MTMPCPFCGQKTSKTMLPPMSLMLRKMYDLVAEAGDDGLSRDDLRQKIYGSEPRSNTTIRTRIHAINRALWEYQCGLKIMARGKRLYLVRT